MEFLLITLPGLANLAFKEVKLRSIDGEIICDNRIIVRKTSQEQLSQLRTIESISRILLIKELEVITTKNIRSTLREFFRSNVFKSFIEKGLRIKSSVFPREAFSRFFLKLIAHRELKRVFGNFKEDKSAENILRIDLVENRLIVSVEVIRDLHKRSYSVIKHPASLNPLIAAAITLALDVSKRDLILDPFTGIGTIPIEASIISNCEAIGFDIDRGFVKGSIENSRVAKVDDLTDFFTADIYKVKISQSFTKIITDPPRGRRLSVSNIKELYTRLFELAKESLLSNGKIGLITPYEGLALKIAKDFNFQCTRICRTLQGGMWVSLLCISTS